MSDKKEVKKRKLATYHFDGCVQTLVGAFSTFNQKATKKEVEEYGRMVSAFSIDEMNEAVKPLGLKVKVRKNLNYMKLPLEAQKKVDEMDRAIGECSTYEITEGKMVDGKYKHGDLLEIGRYIKTPTSKNPKYIPFKKKDNKN